MRPTWAEISLPALKRNFRSLHELVADRATVCCVVKADAYGHGAVQCAQALEAAGAVWFGVSTAEEGVLLRQSGVSGRILLMGGFWPGEEQAIVEYDLTPAVWEARQMELLAAAAKKIHHGKDQPVPAHLKVDTGMSRLGIAVEDIGKFAAGAKSNRHVVVGGIFSHLASADALDSSQTNEQIKRFDEAIHAARSAGLAPVYYHLANSAAMMSRRDTWKNMVRPGIALYGYSLPFSGPGEKVPAQTAAELSGELQPVLAWKTHVLAVRILKAGQAVSYGATYVAKTAGKIAVLPVGYADGFRRELSGKARVIVRNQYAPVAGTVTMDLTMVDVTRIVGVEAGDEVILIGRSGECEITAWDLAKLAGTIPYEILCGISQRDPRKYGE